MLLAAIQLKDEIDLTGLATVLLALATAGLAWWTRASVAQGRTEVERAHRPVLVPIVDRSQRFIARGETSVTVMPHFTQGNPFHVPIRNVGMAPALAAEAELAFGDQHGNPSTHGMESTARARVAGISHTASWVVISFRSVPVWAQPASSCG